MTAVFYSHLTKTLNVFVNEFDYLYNFACSYELKLLYKF